MKYLLLSLFTVIFFSLHSQTSLYNPFPQAPSVSNFNQFVDFPVDLANGIPDISIPIYDIKTAGFELPIKLQYHASGIKVTDRADWVGLKWNLNTGGEITRDVKHIPDEANQGFLLIGNSLHFNGGTTNLSNMWNITNGYIDSEADIFSFSIPGYSGKFYFNDSGNIIQIPKSDVKITRNTINTSQNTADRLNSFTITDPNGIKYYFGKSKDGSITAIDKQYFDGLYLLGDISLPVSWKLLEIENPSKSDRITFTYNSINFSDFYLQGWERYYFQVFSGFALDQSSLSKENQRFNHYPIHFFNNNKKILKSIQSTSNSVKVEFNSNNIRLDSNCSTAKSLDDVIVYYGNVPIKKTKLIYDYYTAPNDNNFNNKRLRLIGVQEVNPNNELDIIPPYQIIYNSSTLPPFDSRATDHWGYYNGQENNNFTNQPNIPQTTINVNWDNDPKIIGNSNRETFETYLKQGIIEKIKLPTGGEIRFEFGANEYFDSNLQQNKEVGGLRIEKISTYIEDIQQSTKEYEYNNPNTLNSSGLLLIAPTHYFSYSIDVQSSPVNSSSGCPGSAGNNVNMQILSENPIQDIYTFDGKHITYGYCKIKYSNGSSELVTFQNSVTPYPDYNFPPKPIFRDLNSNLKINHKTKNDIDIELVNIEKDYILKNFTDTKTLGKVFGIDLYFNDVVGGCGIYRGTLYALNTFNYQTGFNLLEIENKTDNNVNSVTTYVYDEPNYINHNIKSKSVAWNGIIKRTDYKYSTDLNVSFMVNANMIGIPIKTETYYNNEKLSEELTEYFQDYSTTLILPQYIKSKKGTDANGIQETRMTFDSYDNNGNLIQYTPEIGQPVSIVWGYNKTLPIAKIEGVAYSSLPLTALNEAITASNAIGSNYNETTLTTKLDALRNHSSLDDSFVTTYTYKPLIGTSTITDPKGDKYTYSYDFFNRLEFVKDLNGNIVNQYEYHYKN